MTTDQDLDPNRADTPDTKRPRRVSGTIAGLVLLALAGFVRHCDDVARVAVRHLDDVLPTAKRRVPEQAADGLKRLSHQADEVQGPTLDTADGVAAQAPPVDDSPPMVSGRLLDVAKTAGQEVTEEAIKTESYDSDSDKHR